MSSIAVDESDSDKEKQFFMIFSEKAVFLYRYHSH
jgi:hypothetical protein